MALSDYSLADRLVHKIAFASEIPQQLLLDMEQKRFGAQIAAQPIGAPIFVTSLPRAGTTLLLEVLAQHPDLVSHSHRDMPFVLSPMMWQHMTRRFQVEQDLKERSHGDGLKVNVDSPEAFEEVLWMRAFPSHFNEDGIAPWDDPLSPEFIARFTRHMQSLIASRRTTGDRLARYLSKNNANIARVGALSAAFPDAAILVPLRDPLDQARSLLKQHQKALESHTQSGFAKAYARDIGHWEFGANHRPLMFGQMAAIARQYSPETIDYWLHYWIEAYRAVAGRDDCIFVDMERFTGQPDFVRFFEELGLAADAAAVAAAEELVHPIKRYEDGNDINEDLVAEARAIHEAISLSPACRF